MDLFNLAIDIDPQLKSATAIRDANKEERSQSIANFLPRLEVTGSFGRYSQTFDAFYNVQGTQIDQFLGTPSTYLVSRYAVTLRQPLFNLSHILHFKGAGVQNVKADVEYRIAQQDLLMRLAESYFDALGKEHELSFARAEKNAIAKQLQITKQRFEVGIIAVTDVHEAQARHDLSVAQELRADTQLAEAQENLRQIVGIIPRALFKLRDQMPLVPPTPTNINEWVDAARQQNLDVALAQLEVDAMQNAVSEKKAEFYPTVDLNGRYGYFNQRDQDLYQNKLWSAEQRYQDSLISLDFNYIIFEGNRTSSQVRQAEKRLLAAKHKAEQVEQISTSKARSAYLGVLAGMSYVKALSQALSSSDKALKATEAGFDVGTRSAVEVLDAQRDLYRNQRDLSRARIDYVLNTLRLKLAVGLLNIDDLEQVNSLLE